MKEKVAILPTLTLAAAGLPVYSGSSGTSGTQTAGSKAEGASTEVQAPSSEGGELAMTWWGNQVRNEHTQTTLDLYSEQDPRVTFDGQFSERANYWNKSAAAAAGYSMPNIIQMDYKYISQYVNNDLLVDLTPYVENGTIDVSNCNEDILNLGKVGDGLHAICNDINTPVLLYNKVALDEAGTMVKDNITMNESITLCREIREKTGYKINIAYNSGENFIEYFLQANDAVMFGEGELGGAAEDYISYFKLYEEGIRDGWVVGPSIFAEGIIGSVEQDPMVYGLSPEAMSWCAFNYTSQLTAAGSATSEGIEIGMITWPSPDPARSDYLKPNQFFATVKDSTSPDEAARVLDFITNSVECNNILLGERGIPLSTSVADVISPNTDETSQEMTRFINEVVSESSSQINPPSADGPSKVNGLLDKLEESVRYDRMTAEDAGRQLLTEGLKIMGPEKN